MNGSYVMRRFIICTLHQIEQTVIQGDHIKEDGTNGARGLEIRVFYAGNLKGRDCLQNLGVDERITLKQILNK